MSLKLFYSGIALVTGVPALFSGNLVAIAGGVCLIAAAVLVVVDRP